LTGKFPQAQSRFPQRSHTRLSIPLLATRRQILRSSFAGTAVCTLGAGFAIGASTLVSAETVSQAELSQPGPLGDREIGSKNAAVTIVEYASMTCPPCARFATTVLPTLKTRYVDTGKMRFIFREFPFDPVALAAFVLVRCADEHKYFSLLDALFEQQEKWAVRNPLPPLLDIAQHAGFTEDSFKSCLSNKKIITGIEWVRSRGVERFKITGTPTFFINGNKHTGAMTLDEIEQAIKPLLR